MKNCWTTIYRVSYGILGGLALIGAVCMFTPKGSEYSNVLTDKRNIEREIAAKKQDIKRLQIRQDRFTSEASFVERTARECGMIKRGEIVYKFTPDAAQTGSSVN
jgi:cell division protein FtsB